MVKVLDTDHQKLMKLLPITAPARQRHAGYLLPDGLTMRTVNDLRNLGLIKTTAHQDKSTGADFLRIVSTEPES